MLLTSIVYYYQLYEYSYATHPPSLLGSLHAYDYNQRVIITNGFSQDT